MYSKLVVELASPAGRLIPLLQRDLLVKLPVACFGIIRIMFLIYALRTTPGDYLFGTTMNLPAGQAGLMGKE